MSVLSSKIKVAVLRGGPSSEYDISLKTGAYILSILREVDDKYHPIDIFISKDGEWHREGLVHEPHDALRHADVVWNALHGQYGEDGQVQRILGGLQISFTGSGAVTSALAANKDMARKLYGHYGLLTPAHELVTEENFNDDRLIHIFRNYMHPIVVKPARYIDDHVLVYTFHELRQAVAEAFNHSPRVLVEEYIDGDKISCTVIEGAKGEKIYALLPSSRSKFKLKPEENKEVEEMAKRAHEALGLSHYSSSDFIVTPQKKIYILGTNPLPALHEDSLTHKSLRATGWRQRDFVVHILKLAM